MKFNFYNSEKRSGIINYAIILLSVFLLSSVSLATTHVVTVSSFQFTPNTLSVAVGDTVKWQWIDGSHTTTSVTIPNGAASWNSPMTSANQTFSYAVTVAGTYNYQCTPHSAIMMGSFVATSGNGNALLTENFDYPAGDSLGAHGWNWINSAVNPLMVTAPGLVYQGYPLSNIGNATTVLNTGEDMYKDMSDSVSTGAVYASFMVNVSAAQSAGDYFFAFLPPTSTTLYTSRFYARDSAGLRFGVSKSTATAGGIFLTPNSYNLGQTYLAVVKYQYNTAASDDAEIFVYIFSSGIPSTEPSTATIGPVTGTASDNIIGRIALRQGSASNAPTAQVDGFRVGTSWADIVTDVRNVSSNIADGYKLSQNYPNPFNPTTTIKFDIADAGFVNLTVYNSLGKEVSRLVNQNLNRGSYSSEFTGANLTSGVYYYRLTVTGNNNQNFTDTKKLILLK
ncbi:MAG: T9SS type A sorting domain-containing protein [Ignavibacteriae bacterium]|nr:T9SS type A sorting domain-containing protein [Ignavibacteriota bacterium]